MDGRKNNKGVKGNKGGRPPKAEEQKLIEHLSPFHDLAIEKLQDAVKDGKDWAIKLYLEYYYGKPKQVLDAQVDSEVTIIRRTIK